MKHRTAKLEIANQELQRRDMDEIERLNHLALCRENRIIGLKREVNELLQQAGQVQKYLAVE